MSKQIRELLDRAALEPSRPVDVESCHRAGRARRRRLGAVVGIVAAVAVVGGTVAVTASGDASSVRTPVSDDGLPEGWERVEAPDGSLSIAVPPGWMQLENDVGVVDGPENRLVAGTAERPQPGVITACIPEENVPTKAGTWVSIYEYDPAGPFTMPTGDGGFLPEVFGDRPTDFRLDQGLGPRCGGTTVDSSPNGTDFLPFRDQGRVFLARIVVVGDPRGGGLTLGREILNTLRVEPRTAEEPVATTPSTTTPTTVPPPATSVPFAAPMAPSPEVEGASAAVLGWLNSEPPDPGSAYIEDYDAIADLLREGQAQHSSEALAAFSGRVESATVIDTDRVEVHYTVLQYGRPLFPNLAGMVVRIDGTWKVSRGTVCALLSRGGITCPPRAG